MKRLMLGNEAVARGLYEAGCRIVSSYPGTPSTEITEFAAKYDEIYAEWAPNEKVACETAVGASIGGGRIQIRQLNGMPLCFSAEQPTLIVNNEDQPGSVADVSRLLAEHGINIATFQVNRSSRGGTAVMVIECDATLSDDIAADIRRLPGILNAVCV